MTLKDTENKIQRKSYFLPEFNAVVNSEFNDPQAIRQDFMVSNLNRSKTQFVGLEDTGSTTEDDFRNRILTGIKGIGQSVAQPIFQTARSIEASGRFMLDLGDRQKARTDLAIAYSKGEVNDEEYLNNLFSINTKDYETARQKSLAEVKLTNVAHNNFIKAVGLEMDEKDRPAWATGGQVVGSVMQSMVVGVFLKAPIALSTLWGLSTANQSWEEALENGKSRTRAAGLGITNGTINAAIEMIGAEKILSAFKANIPLMKILVSALGEGGEELGQGIVDEALMQKLGGRQKEFGDTVKDLFASFLIGGFAGGGMAAGHIAFSKIVEMSDKKTAVKIADKLQSAAASAPAQAEAEKLIWRQEHPVNFKDNSANATIEETKALIAKQDRKTQIEAIRAEKEAMLKQFVATDEEARAGSVLAANIVNNIAISNGITPELANNYLNLSIERKEDIANGVETASVEDNAFDTVLLNQAAAAMYKNNRTDIGEFVDFAKSKAEKKKSYFEHTTQQNNNFTIPTDTILHDEVKHPNLTNDDWQNLISYFDNASFAEAAAQKPNYDGKVVIGTLKVGEVSYGISGEVDNNGNLRITTFFKDNADSIQKWTNKKAANALKPFSVLSSQLTPTRDAGEFVGRPNNSVSGKKINVNTPEFKKWFGDSKVVDENGKPLVVYHGTKRPDRIGEQFRKERATSGPMAFFTDNAEIANNYATGKDDTSISAGDYNEWFKIDGLGLKEKGETLKSNVNNSYIKKLEDINIDEEGNITYKKGQGSIMPQSNFNYLLKQEARGNSLVLAKEIWLSSGELFGQEEKFFDVLTLMGINNIERNFPYDSFPGVFPVYLSIKNALNTAKIPANVITALEKAAFKAPKEEERGADIWAKKTRNPKEWIKQLKEDIKNKENSFVWSSIPDWVTDTLKTLGYDGIKDMGGKMGGEGHTVFIPFEPTQIKSINNRGTFDENNPNIYYQEKRGSIDLSKKGGVYYALVKLMQERDQTTILHELGHLWLYTAQDIYSKEEFDDMRKDLDTWIGKPKVKDGRFIYTDDQQKKLAEGLETYLGEGKAPTPALQSVFDKFREWFVQIYNGALVEMSDAGRAVYNRMFQLEGQAAEESLTLYQDAVKNKKVREGIEQLRKDGKMKVEGLTMQDIENYLQILDMGAPPLPKSTLITYLKKYGADYSNAAKIDKEEYLNAKIPNRPTGIGDGLARQLIEWGFMDGKIEDYNDLSRMDEEAAELIHRALQGDNVYRLEDMQDVDRFEQYKEAVAMAEDALGGRIEEYRRVADIIKGLKIEGYRPVNSADIEFVADKLEELSNITEDETARVLSTQIDTAKKQAAEWKEAAERRLQALGRATAKAEEDAEYAVQKAELANQQKYFDEVLQKNKTQAQRIKRTITEEINKRELEGKDTLLKELNSAQTPQEIFAAADKLIEELQKEYDKTPEGQSAKKKLDIPSTNWEAKKLTVLKELNNLTQNVDEKTREALEWIRQDNLALFKQRVTLNAEEKAQVSEAKAFLKEDYTPRIMSILDKALQNEEHLYPKDKALIISHYAKTITNFEKIQKYNIDSFINWAAKLQKENYNRYIWRKLNTLIGRKQFEKIGKVKKAKYSETAMGFLKEAAEVWDLTPENAEVKLRAQMDKSFDAFEKGEMTNIKDVLLNRVLEFKIKGKDNNPEASRRTFDEIEALLKSGRADARNANIRKQLNREVMTEAVSQAIRRRKYPLGAKWFLTLPDTNFKEFITNALGTFEHDWVTPEGNITKRKIDFTKQFDVLTGQRGTKLYAYTKTNEKNEIFKRTMGIESNNGILNKIAELQKTVYEAENYMRRTNEMDGKAQAQLLLNGKWLTETTPDIDKLNKLEIMSIYEWYKNSLIDPETGNDYGLRGRLLRQYGQTQLNEMFGLLSEKEKALADGLQQFVAAQWAAENAVFSELHGFSLPNDPEYLPSVARRMDIGGDIDYMREYVQNSTHPSFSMERTKSFRVEMKPTSILTIVENHTARAGEYINEAIPFTEIKGILKNNKIERAFEAAFGRENGPKVYSKMLRVIDLQAPQKTKPLALIRSIGDTALNGWVKAAMALKLTIGAKQMATGISFTEKMPVEKYFKYWAEGLAKPKKTYDFMSKNVPDIRVRFAQGNINESISRAMASRDIALYSTKWNNFTNLMMLNIRLGDAGSFIYGGYPYYKYLTEDLKMSPAQARIAFMEQGESTLQSSQKALLGEWQANQTSYTTRIFSVFRNQPKQYFGKLITSYIQYKNGEISEKDLGKVWMLYTVANPMIYELLGLAWIFSDDDDDEQKKKGIYSVLSSPFTGLASVNAFSDAAVRYLLDAVYAKYQGKKLPAPQSIRIPAFDDIKKDISGAVKAYNNAGSMEDLLSEMTVSDFATSIAALLKYTGLPAPTMLNIAGGVGDVAKGDVARGGLRIAGYTEYRAGKVTGESKKEVKARRLKKPKRKKERE